MSKGRLVQEILSQILEASARVERRFSSISTPDDFLASQEGIDRLDSICMMLITIGESLKNLDKVTDGKLLPRHPEVDWKGAKGLRDIISHHYFDIDAEVVFTVCEERLPGLVQAIKSMMQEVGTDNRTHP
jgi:uncharacterized protein with HEPN domain